MFGALAAEAPPSQEWDRSSDNRFWISLKCLSGLLILNVISNAKSGHSSSSVSCLAEPVSITFQFTATFLQGECSLCSDLLVTIGAGNSRPTDW
jgi:hypothetical protein